MKYLFIGLCLAGCAHMVVSQLDLASILNSLSTSFSLILQNGINGYNPFLTSEQVLHFACAKPSDKIFQPVYFNDPDMAKKLDLTKRISFITHGWLENGYTIWIKKISTAWVANYDTNVCRIDWSVYSMVDYVVAAKRNIYLVSKHLAKFLKTLHDDHDVAYSNVTLMGHSLGGQITGITGNIIGAKTIGRIIAMDPAGIWFTHPYTIPEDDRLDKMDAQFVTVIHSNNYMHGVGFSIGHADFYVNGRDSIQPGCTYPDLYGNYAYDVDPITCSHFRAVKCVDLTMNKNPLCRAIKCDTYSDYENHQCTNITDTWGIDSDLIEGDFYFWTGKDPKCTNLFWATDEEN